MSPFAPRVTAIKVPVDKIGEVIGPKGKMINSITEQTGADISIEDDGTIYVGAADGPSAEAAIDMINAIANPQLPKIGERFLGTVVKTAAFGAFVSLLPGKDGLVHISQAGQRQAHRQGRGRRQGRRQDPRRDRRHRQPRQDQPGPGDRARPRTAPRPLPTRRRRTCRPRSARVDRTRHAGGGRARARPPARRVGTARDRAARRPAGDHRERARRPLGVARHLGRRRVARRAPAQAGAAHYLEHLLFKGTRRRTARQIAEEIDAVGGELNAFTAKEHTCYYAHVLDTDLPLAVDLVADVVLEALLAPTDVEIERSVVLEEIAMRDDDPEDLLHERSTRRCSATHPLGRPVHRAPRSRSAAMSRDVAARVLARPLHDAADGRRGGRQHQPRRTSSPGRAGAGERPRAPAPTPRPRRRARGRARRRRPRRGCCCTPTTPSRRT